MNYSRRVQIQLLCATLAWLGSVGIASAAWTFQSPSEGATFTKTSDIAFAGNGAPNSSTFTVQCFNDDTNVIEQSTSGTSMAMGGYWSGTLTKPSVNWVPDNPKKHLLKLVGGDGVKAERTVNIVN